VPRALEAPFALVAIVRCSKSWTIVDAERLSQCSCHPCPEEEDAAAEKMTGNRNEKSRSRSPKT
jgi:hypothetical protein